MDAATTPQTRRRTLTAGAVAISLLGVLPGLGLSHAAAQPAYNFGGGCPKAEKLVSSNTFTTRTVSPGVTESTGTTQDAKGDVQMHVLRVNLATAGVGVTPLVRSLASVHPLSKLAKHHKHLVAATNTGYFDLGGTGAPTQPLIVDGVPEVMSSSHQEVVGVSADGRFQAGQVWLSSKVTDGKSSHSVNATNEVYGPSSGLGVYTSRWGSSDIPGGRYGSERNQAVVAHSATSNRSAATVPANGYVLQARGSSADEWLRSVKSGSTVSVTSKVKTDAPHPFTQAYGVGLEIVAQHGVARSGFSCDSANTKQPARTAIGWTDGGRKLVVAVVTQHYGTSYHGLDENQMSELMVELGVDKAFAFDGSGSSELLTKPHHGHALKLQNYPADGQERPMPVGLGFSYTAPKHKKHH